MVLEGVVIGLVVAFLAGAAALTRSVYRLTAVVENGLADKLNHIEERVDALYDHLIED